MSKRVMPGDIKIICELDADAYPPDTVIACGLSNYSELCKLYVVCWHDNHYVHTKNIDPCCVCGVGVCFRCQIEFMCPDCAVESYLFFS